MSDTNASHNAPTRGEIIDEVRTQTTRLSALQEEHGPTVGPVLFLADLTREELAAVADLSRLLADTPTVE